MILKLYKYLWLIIFFAVFAKKLASAKSSSKITEVASVLVRHLEKQIADSKCYGQEFATVYFSNSVERISDMCRHCIFARNIETD